MRNRLLQASMLVMALAYFGLYAGHAHAAIKGFKSTAHDIQQGMVLRNAQLNNGGVQLQPATRNDGTNVVGIATDVPEDQHRAQQENGVVFVETSGEVVALVTNKNGDIVAGDKLTLSAFPGVLTKIANTDNGVVIATAKEAFNPARAQNLQLAGASVTVSSITVDFGQTGSETVDPASTGLRQFGEGILDEDVSATRVIFAGLLGVVILATTSVMLYGAVESALFAVGRNPLARRTILLVMARTIGVALAIMVAGLAAVYLILSS